MKLQNIISVLERYCPLNLAENYDNCGLQVGDPTQEVNGIVLCLDCVEETVQQAVDRKAELIISHHPVIFNKIHSLASNCLQNRILLKLIKNDIALYSIHTNLDNMFYGVNYKIAQKLGLSNFQILEPKSHLMKKLIVFVPNSHINKVKEALFSAGAGALGNYEECSFSSSGIGTFLPLGGAKPFIGSKNKLESLEEIKLELIYYTWQEDEILHKLRESHPYEQIAFDLIRLDNNVPTCGSGLVGEIDRCSPAELLNKLKTVFKAGGIRHSQFIKSHISKVAVCGGSGSFLIDAAIKKGADAFITGDIKYHEFFKAEANITLIDIGHYESEQYVPELILEILSTKMPKLALSHSIINTNPVFYYH